ncbi:MAG: hypothetical protein LBC89_06905, partial [Bacteroidales bacterium]|nr:hypothetical protein [Bacteroidales bacterium]
TPARYLLRYLNDSIVFDEISPDYTNMNYYNWNKKEGQTFRNEVVPWVLGQGTNEWAPLKLAEAWARMITKFPLRLSYIHNENTNEIYKDSILYKQISGKYKTGGDRFNVWNAFLDTLLAAQKVASQDMIYPAYNQLRRIADSLIIIGKTGTPDDFVRADWEHFDISGKIKYDVGLYSFSLMTEKQYQRLKNNISTPKDSTQNAGITCIIRIVHSYPKDKPYKLLTNFPDGIMSYDARNFLLKEQYDGKPKKDFSNTRLRKILFYTDKLFR